MYFYIYFFLFFLLKKKVVTQHHLPKKRGFFWNTKKILFLKALLWSFTVTHDDCAQMAMAFLMYILGAYLFAKGGQTVSLR